MNADGTCHAGDLMEHGTPFVALYTAEELCRIVNAEKAEAWSAGYVTGHRQGCPTGCTHGVARNPYVVRCSEHGLAREHHKFETACTYSDVTR